MIHTKIIQLFCFNMVLYYHYFYRFQNLYTVIVGIFDKASIKGWPIASLECKSLHVVTEEKNFY